MKFSSNSKKIFIIMAVILSLFVVIGCGSTGGGDDTSGGNNGGDSGGDAGGSTTIPDTVLSAGKITLSTDKVIIKSDNSDYATLTATVLDGSNGKVEGVLITFSSQGNGAIADGGELSNSKLISDENGQGIITFSSGTLSQQNQTVTITATVTLDSGEEIRATRRIQVTGTTITANSDNYSLELGGDNTASISVNVKDASSTPISFAVVDITASSTSTGQVTITPSSGQTDVNGIFEATVTGSIAGNVSLSISALGAETSVALTVGAELFGIRSPVIQTDALGYYAHTTKQGLLFQVFAPNSTQVTFATSLGSFYSGDVVSGIADGSVTTGSAKVLTNIAVIDQFAYATFVSDVVGTATVQVFDSSDTNTKDTIPIAISAPANEAANITLQASATNLAPSTTLTKNQITLTAVVTNLGDEVVGNALVAFTIANATGGGEKLNPAIAITDSSGRATTNFTSGSVSTDQAGINITASIVGTANLSDDISVVIGGTAGSVIIGEGTTIRSILDDTAYELPMNVQVSDTNGNPVAGANVSLSLWPIKYAVGCLCAPAGTVDAECKEYGVGDCCGVTPQWFDNEDNLNLNLNNDGGEDIDNSGNLTPPNSAAGSVPATVQTGDTGIMNFNLTYSKANAWWIEAEITASTQVYGSETTSRYRVVLNVLEGEECRLNDSPFNPK